MKHTIPIDAARSIQLEDIGPECHVRLLVFGVPTLHQQVEPTLLIGLADAANKVAMDAITSGNPAAGF